MCSCVDARPEAARRSCGYEASHTSGAPSFRLAQSAAIWLQMSVRACESGRGVQRSPVGSLIIRLTPLAGSAATMIAVGVGGAVVASAPLLVSMAAFAM